MFTFIEAGYTLILTLIICSPLLIYCLSNTPNRNKDGRRKHHRLPLFGMFFSRMMPGDDTNSRFYEDFRGYQAPNAFYPKGEYPTSIFSPLHWITDWGMAIPYIIASIPFIWIMVKFIFYVLSVQLGMEWTDSNQNHFEATFWLFFVYIIMSWLWVYSFLHVRSKAWSLITGVCVFGTLIAFYVVLGLTLRNFGIDSGKYDTAYWLTLGYVILVAGVGAITAGATVLEWVFRPSKKRRVING